MLQASGEQRLIISCILFYGHWCILINFILAGNLVCRNVVAFSKNCFSDLKPIQTIIYLDNVLIINVNNYTARNEDFSFYLFMEREVTDALKMGKKKWIGADV